MVFVLWDAGRPDRLTPYGADRDTTPNVMAFSKEAVVFENARSNSTATTHGTRSLLSGNYVSRHMLGTNHPPFLTQYLSLGGYNRFVITVAGTDYNGVSLEAFGRNWSEHPSEMPKIVPLDSGEDDGNKKDDWKNEHVIKALLKLHAELGSLDGVFVYLHLVGPHYPWIDTRYGDEPHERYDGHLKACDDLFGKMMTALKSVNAWDDALVLLTADHGTALGEHGRLAGYLTYEEQVRIPLIIKTPGIRPKRVTHPIAGIDVVPTLLHAVRAPMPESFHGQSFVPFLMGEGAAPEPPVTVVSCAFRDAYAIYDSAYRWKLHHDREHRYEALYDLHADPTERKNLIATHPEEANELRVVLNDWLFQGKGKWATPDHY
jgi:arylsulfatase A-like enzyme